MRIKVLLNRIFNGSLFIILLCFVGCTTTDDVGCMPIYIGTGYDEDGMRKFIYTNEIGCPRIEER